MCMGENPQAFPPQPIEASLKKKLAEGGVFTSRETVGGDGHLKAWGRGIGAGGVRSRCLAAAWGCVAL